MLRVLPSTFKPVNNLICSKTCTGLLQDMYRFDVGRKKRNTAVQLVACFLLLPVFPYHMHIVRVFIENDN